MNEVCASCETVYPYEAAIGLGLPREYCECGGALRSVPDPSPKLDVRGAGPHRNQRPFDCGFGVTLGRAGLSETNYTYNWLYSDQRLVTEGS